MGKVQSSRAADAADPALSELIDIKRLLVLLMYKLGSSQSEIAVALQKDRSQVSRLMSAKGIKQLNGASTAQ
jgi:DNA-directed RNA polymerase specialized sigma subunit